MLRDGVLENWASMQSWQRGRQIVVIFFFCCVVCCPALVIGRNARNYSALGIFLDFARLDLELSSTSLVTAEVPSETLDRLPE